MGEILVRAAGAADVERIQEIELAAATLFDGTGLLDGVSPDPVDAGRLHDAILDRHLWVAIGDDDRPVGFALGGWCGDDAHLWELDVDPAFAHRGIGARLVDEVVEWARRQGRTRLTLTTFADVPWNGPYYARLGFVVLPPERWTAALADAIDGERAAGLDVDARVVMARPARG